MKNKLLTLLIGVSVTLALVAVPLMTACAPEVEVPEVEVPVAPKTVSLGYMHAMSGPAASWGLSAYTGVKLWADRVNDEGGLDVGGEKYLVNVIMYDDEYTGSKALVGAKKMILEDDIKVLLMSAGPPSTGAMPFTTEQKVITIQQAIIELRPDRPYTFGASVVWPLADAMVFPYIVEAHPEVKRVAFTCQDNELGYYSLAIVESIAETHDLDLVYNKLFSSDTVDFAPIMTAILATDPDLIYLGGITGDFRGALVEQAYLQGVETGDVVWLASEWYVAQDVLKTTADFLEGAVTGKPDLDDPMLPPQALEYWNKWHAKYGPGAPEDVYRAFVDGDYQYYGFCRIWEAAVEAAGTFDSDAVKAAMLAQIPFHVYGSAGWWGEELVGISQMSAINQFVTEVQGGKLVVVGVVDFFPWLDENVAALAEKFAEYELMGL